MKKWIFMFVFLFCLVGCEKKEEIVIPNGPKVDPPKNLYQDTNPIQVGLYQYRSELGAYVKVKETTSSYPAFQEIGVFSCFFTNQDKINGYDFKSLWNQFYRKYSNIQDYRIGYQISFDLIDGTHFDQTFIKVHSFDHFTFSKYLYIWLYDDIHQTSSWYSHLEEKEFLDTTQMTSIKFMTTGYSKEIKGPISVTVFSYKDENDFDGNGQYRGNSKYTILLKKDS